MKFSRAGLYAFLVGLLGLFHPSNALAERLDNSDKELSIAIIGAGPSGLMAAAELKERGYHNVIVYEASNQIGGKVKSVQHEGHTYEMGAVVTAPDYEIVLGLAKELGIKVAPTPLSYEISPEGHVRGMSDYVWERHGKATTIASVYQFYRLVKRYPDFFKPGFEGTPSNMHKTFEEYMKEQNIEAISDAYRTIMVGCGYGFAEDMPAPYWMKLMKTFAYEGAKYTLNPFAGTFFNAFPNGWQQLWVEFAKARGLDIRLNARVKSIRRNSDRGIPRVTLHVGINRRVFDRVILTVPHLASKLMDLNQDELAVFSRVRTIPYKTTLVEIDGLPKTAHLWPRAYSTKYDDQGMPNDGKVMLISNNKGTNVYQVYQFTNQGKSSSDLRDVMIANIARMKGEVKNVLVEDMYDYIPHFDADAFREEIPLKLIDMQGQGGVYFTGALMNFETVELSAQHGRHVVQQYFE